MQTLFLRQNIQVEPLLDQWYAWPHLIPPATAARNVTERHFKIMDSYVKTSDIHASAVRNPKMLGGPFIDYGGKRVDEIRALRERTARERLALVSLSSAIEDLDRLLRENATGASLEALYPQVPPALRGYVELVYDLNHHPSFRLIEPLLYRSQYYDKSQQSLMLSTLKSDDRPFILSTPRLESHDSLHLKLCFDSPAVDALFRLKTVPRCANDIESMLGVTKSDDVNLLHSFLSAEAPLRYQPYDGPGARWRYFGHACILIECAGISVLFDPVLSYTYESSISRYTYQDLPDVIDYVLITHNHQDHVLFETLLQIRHKVKKIIVPRNGNGHLQDPSLKLLLEHTGFRNVHELSEMEEISDGLIRIMGLPFFGEHADLDISTKMAWLVSFHEYKLLFAADSCNVEPLLYHHIAKEIGEIDALFLGMECDGAPLSWLYGPLLTQKLDRAADKSRRLAGSNFEQGMGIVDAFVCAAVYVYAMGQEPWLNYIMSLKYTGASKPIIDSDRLISTCRQRGINAERLFGEKEILLP